MFLAGCEHVRPTRYGPRYMHSGLQGKSGPCVQRGPTVGMIIVIVIVIVIERVIHTPHHTTHAIQQVHLDTLFLHEASNSPDDEGPRPTDSGPQGKCFLHWELSGQVIIVIVIGRDEKREEVVRRKETEKGV